MAEEPAAVEENRLWSYYNEIDRISGQYQSFLKDQTPHSPDLEDFARRIRNHKIRHRSNRFLFERILDKLLFFERTWDQWRHDRWTNVSQPADKRRSPNHYALATAEKIADNKSRLQQLFAIQKQYARDSGTTTHESMEDFKSRLTRRYHQLSPQLEKGTKLAFAWVEGKSRCDLLVEKRHYPSRIKP